MKRKAQIQMGESIIVLIIFLLLVVFGVVMYAKIQQFTGKRQVQEHQEDINIQIEQKIRFLPEITCGTILPFDCYDSGKLYAFRTTRTDPEFELYYNSVVFPRAKVTLVEVFPIPSSFILYDVSEEEQDQYMGSTPFRTPVVIYDPIYDTYNFGFVEIEVYQ